MLEISVARDFSRFPFGRYPDHGPYSGQRFRDEFMVPRLKEGSLTVDLDGARGLAPSFLEEAFGGLVRLGFDLATLRARLTIVCEADPSRVDEAWAYIVSADGRVAS
ncbi:MAG: STAS-like domain-containing protein [Alphaproteobacteria bacterium]|uniref:DUF4325 domain-containing protein n=1 Tax=viral metagenome TaxID=1070528 RepID=A0A6H1ZIK6_9ZZZZ|nr:STAS-like domain-containing protein [Alphaproteobacteria bacterium]MBU2379189.1 STAS-like domain-containing protein [Alphaproteobacteria bacterium]